MRSPHLNKERHLFNSLFHSWERLGRPRVPTKLRENWGYVLIMHQCNNVTQCNNSPMHQCNNEDCGHKQSSQIGMCRKTMSRDDDLKDRIIACTALLHNECHQIQSLFIWCHQSQSHPLCVRQLKLSLSLSQLSWDEFDSVLASSKLTHRV